MNIKNALNNKITLLNALSSHQPTLTKNLFSRQLTYRVEVKRTSLIDKKSADALWLMIAFIFAKWLINVKTMTKV
ncbi:hypothetical protein DJ444_04320 [Staphylococcus pseudintermedius]|nr:hypothetical protein DJ444_04320 [Staphylococcus pseudintermedius]